ncbi:MAG: hypothetical protein QOC66_235 [Pseudonocardiales bacterium]|nr:hypothetical protein [Pseudonocardiales bacterium]
MNGGFDRRSGQLREVAQPRIRRASNVGVVVVEVVAPHDDVVNERKHTVNSSSRLDGGIAFRYRRYFARQRHRAISYSDTDVLGVHAGRPVEFLHDGGLNLMIGFRMRSGHD